MLLFISTGTLFLASGENDVDVGKQTLALSNDGYNFGKVSNDD